VIFDEDSMLREKSEKEDKAQGGISDSSAANTQEKGVEFSDNSKRPEGSEEDSSDSDGDKQEAIQEQPRPLRRLVRVTVPPDEGHVSFTLVTETGEPNSYREAIEADDHDKWITAMEQKIESLDRNQIWNLLKDSKAKVADGSFARRTMSNTRKG